MLSNAMHKALNEHMTAEFYAAYLYLSMAAHFEHENLPGMAAWMHKQSAEEVEHAMKFFHYLNERGAKVTLQVLDQPTGSWSSPLAVFKDALKHERFVTGRIHHLVDMAQQEKDFGTANFLQWFVAEQVEEEAQVEPIVARLEMAGDHPAALLFMDRELGSR